MNGEAGLLRHVFGLGPAPRPTEDHRPAAVLQVEWQWLHPLQAILRFSGWTIHHVVSDPGAAAWVRTLWKVHKESGRVAAAREGGLEVAEALAWRRDGLPIPCPLCGRRDRCPHDGPRLD